MNARYRDSYYMSRTIYIINALLGSVGAKGGLPLANKPGAFGHKGLKELINLYDKPKEKRVDGVGWKYPHFEAGPGLAHLAFEAIETQDPYPIKAYIAYRHDPLMGYADPERLRRVFDKLDFLVSVTFTWSDTAWYSDVVLPLSPYLERESTIATKNDLLPYFFVRQRVVQPRYDTRADWEIITGLAKRMGLDKLAFDTVEDIRRFQLEGTGMTIEDFDRTGLVRLGDAPVYKDIGEGSHFKTPSEKIEMIDDKLEKQGIPSFLPYQSPARPPEGSFRLTFGRCGFHTQGHTVNNPLLFEQMPENVLWINAAEGRKLGISDGDTVAVSNNGYTETIRAKLTEHIHSEAVFVVHGFGHRLPIESRAFGRGLADNKFMPGGNRIYDKAGGGVAFQEHFVSVKKVSGHDRP